MAGFSLVSTRRRQAALLSGLGLLAYFFKIVQKRQTRHARMIRLFSEKEKEIAAVCGYDCPSPKWLFGQWFALLAFCKAIREHRHLHMLSELHEVFGGTFSMPLPFQATYIAINTEENVEHILKHKFDNYVKGETYLLPRMMDLLGNGIFNSDGPTWYHQRKTSSHMFSQKKLTNHIWKAIDKNSNKVVNFLLSRPAGDTVDIFNVMNRFTLDTIGEVGFARNIGSLENADSPFLKSFDRAQQIVFLRMVMPFWRLRRLLRLGEEHDADHHFRLLQDYALETVRDLKDNLTTDRGDSFIGLFMQESEKSGKPYDEKLMQDMVLNFLIAGRDTTAQSLSWTLYLLLGNADVERKVLAEVAEVCGDGPLQYEDLNRLTFLQCVINESLRLYPSVAIDAKKSLEDDMLPDGTIVEKDDVVVYNIFAMGRSKEIWGEDADQFRPERWIGKDFPSLYLFPVFNAGPRECLGRRLASVEMKACLASILRSVKLTLAVPRDAIHYDAQLTIGMASGLPCKVERR